MVVAEQIAIAASGLARKASANGLSDLAGLIEQVVLEAWREASDPGAEPSPARTGAADKPPS